MKAAETKTTATPAKKSSPFFSKDGEQNFFGSSIKEKPFFSKLQNNFSAIQPKLTIGQPNDKYEQEADAMADKVVQRLASPEILTKKEPAVQAKPLAGSFTPLVQTKCAACEQEKLQKKEEEDLVQESSLELQRKPIFESNAEPPDDENNIQRKCAECEKKKPLQKQSDGTDSEVSSGIESKLSSSKNGGNPLTNDVRDNMESSFGADFSNVRVHTDSNAVQMNKDLSAQAFTHGSDIYFNSGKYNSSSTAGQHLLAHELTHVVQQNGAAIKEKPQQLSTSKKAIQRFPYWRPWDENKKIGKLKGAWLTGGDLHDEIFKELGTVNKELFTEAPVPNADLKGIGWGKRGSADLYMAEGSNKTVGFVFEGENDPGYLPPSPRHPLKFSGGKYNHSTQSAPGYFPPSKIRTGGKIVRESEGPTSIKMGDLKPFGDIISESTWSTQVNNYIGGFRWAHDELEKYQGKKNWNLTTTATMKEGDIPKIPDKYRFGSGKGQSSRRLKLAGVSDRYNMLERNVMGKVYMAYNTSHDGIWNYFWVLDTPLSASAMPPVATMLWTEYTKRLIDPLKGSPLSISPKREANHPIKNPNNDTISAINKNEIQKKKTDDPFKKNWKTWKADHSRLRGQYLKIEKEKGYKTVEEELLANEAQEIINQKLKVKVPVDTSTRQKENQKMHKQLEFWSNRASVAFGYFRLIFGKVFLKLYQVYEVLKKRVSTLAKSRKGMKSVPSGVIGAAIKVLFKAFKMAGVFLIHETVTLMINSLQEGVINKIQAYINSIVPETYKEKMAEVQNTITKLELLAAKGIEDMLNSLFGTHIKIFETIEEISRLSNTIATIVSVVRWGVRVIECVSPPVVGCLWMLVEFVGDALLSQLVSSCWFMKKVYPHVLGLKILKDIPIKIASSAVDSVNGWLKGGPLDGMLAPVPTGGIDPNAFKPECAEGKEPTPAQKALQDMFETLDEDKMYALQQLMERGHVNPTQELSKQDIEELTKTLQALDKSKLKEFVEKYPEEHPDPPGKLISVKDFMKKFEEQKDAVLAQTGQGGTAPGQPGTPGAPDPGTPPTQDPAQTGGQVEDSESEPPTYATEESAKATKTAEAYVKFARNFKSWGRVTNKKPYYNFKKPLAEIVAGEVIYASIYGKISSKVGFFTYARIKILKIKETPLSWDIQILWTDDAGTTDGKIIPKDQLKMVGIKQTVLSDAAAKPKLIVNQPRDKYEQEADTMADKVVQRLTEPENEITNRTFAPNNSSQAASLSVQTKCSDCDQEEKLRKKEEEEDPSKVNLRKKPIFESNVESTPEDDIQRKCATCEKEVEKNVQAKSNDSTASASGVSLETQLASSKNSGSPLPEDARSKMESSFGADFSEVRIHNDGDAAEMNASLQAQAFTHGSDIYFNMGKYDTTGKDGQQLLAHELTHVLQQNGNGKIQQKISETIHRKPAAIPISTVHSLPTPTIQMAPEEDSPGFFSRVGNFVGKVANGITNTVSSAASAVASIGSDILASVRNTVSGGIDRITSKWDEIRDSAGSHTSSLQETASGVLNVFLGPLAMMANALRSIDADGISNAWNLITGFAQATLSSIQQLINNITATLQIAWRVFNGLVSSIIEGVQSTIERLRDKLGDSIADIIQQVLSPIISLQKSIASAWNSVMQFITNLIEDIRKNIIGYLIKIANHSLAGFIQKFRELAKTYRTIRLLMENPDILVDPLAKRIEEMLPEAPKKAAGLVLEKYNEITGKQQQNETDKKPDIMRQGNAATAPARSTTGFIDLIEGLETQFIVMWNQLSPKQIIKEALYTLINPIPGTIEDWNNLKKDMSEATDSFYSPDGLHDLWTNFFTHFMNYAIILLRFIMSVLGRWWLWITIALTLGGAILGGLAGAFGLGVLGGIAGTLLGPGLGNAIGVGVGTAAGGVAGAGFGAGVGFSAGLAFGEYLLIAYIAVETLCFVHALASLVTGLLTGAEKLRYFQRTITCLFGAIVGSLLVLLAFVGKAVAEAISNSIGKILAKAFPQSFVEGFSKGLQAGPKGPISRFLRSRKGVTDKDKPPIPEKDKPNVPEKEQPPPERKDPPKEETDPKKKPIDPLEVAKAAARTRLAKLRERLGHINDQVNEMPDVLEGKKDVKKSANAAEEKLKTIEKDIGEATSPEELNLIESEMETFNKKDLNELQSFANKTNIPIPTIEEQALIDRYTEAIRRLKKATETIKAGADEKTIKAAEADRATALAEMDTIEAQAINKHNVPGSNTSRLADHIDSLTRERFNIVNNTGAGDPSIGLSFENCEAVAAVKRMPNGTLKGLRFGDIQGVLGEPTSVTGSLADASGRQTGAVRIEWQFSDGSRIHVDVPGGENASPFAVNRSPHAGMNAPSPTKVPGSNQAFAMSETGTVVPGNSASAHTPVQRDAGLNFLLKGREKK